MLQEALFSDPARLAAMGQRARGLSHPNAAREIATLDQMSHGRLDVGVGSGVSPYELAHFGVQADQAKPIYTETLQALTTALATGTMRHEGTLIPSVDAELSIRPVQLPHPPLWYASSNTATAEWAGGAGINFVGTVFGHDQMRMPGLSFSLEDVQTGRPIEAHPKTGQITTQNERRAMVEVPDDHPLRRRA